MDLNDTETWTNSTTTKDSSSVFYCPKAPDLTWDLDDTTVPWILVVIKSFASLATVFLNALVIIAVMLRNELQKHSYVLLSSMAAADLLVGALTMPFSTGLDVLLALRRVEHFCILDAINVYLTYCVSWCALYHLTAIAWERFVAIRKSMRYTVTITRSRLIKLAIVVWLVAIFTTTPPFIMEAAGVDFKFVDIWVTFASICGAVSLISTGYFYVKVYIGVRKRNIDKISQVTALAQALIEKKVAKTTALLTLVLVVSFVPGVVVSISTTLRTGTSIRVSELVMQLHSVVNPMLYCFRDRRFRNAALEMLRMKKPQAIQLPTTGASRHVRRKEPGYSTEKALEKENREPQNHGLTRSASSKSVDVCFDCPRRSSLDMVPNRSTSAPSLAQCNSSFEGSQMQLPSTVITTATIREESSTRRQNAGKSNAKVPTDEEKTQDTGNAIQRVSKSRLSNHSNASMKDRSYENSKEGMVCRLKNAPTNCRIVPHEVPGTYELTEDE